MSEWTNKALLLFNQKIWEFVFVFFRRTICHLARDEEDETDDIQHTTALATTSRTVTQLVIISPQRASLNTTNANSANDSKKNNSAVLPRL